MKKEEIKIIVEDDSDVIPEYGEVKVTRRYVDALKEEAKKQKVEMQIKTIQSSLPNVFIQKEVDIPDGIELEVFDEED